MAYEYMNAPAAAGQSIAAWGVERGATVPSYYDTTPGGYLCPLSRESCLGQYCGASVSSYGKNWEIETRCGLASAGSGGQRPNVRIASPDGGGRR